MSVEVLDVAIRVGMVLATAFLFGIVFLTYLRLRSRKILLVSIGFGIFFAHALIYLPELISHTYHVMLTENMHLTIHFVALLFILLGILKD